VTELRAGLDTGSNLGSFLSEQNMRAVSIVCGTIPCKRDTLASDRAGAPDILSGLLLGLRVDHRAEQDDQRRQVGQVSRMMTPPSDP
jgi:hypothetical protein